MNALQELYPLTDKSGVLTVDSRLIAEDIGVFHSNFIELIKKYQNEIEHTMGPVRFETGPRKDGNLGGSQPVITFLTEDQALFAGTLCRNTPTVIEFKRKLVTSFQNARRAAQQFAKELSRKDLALMIIQAEEELEKVKAVLVEQQPKVELADQCLIAVNSQSMGETAKTLGLGRNRLFELLRDKNILMNNNIPYQYFLDLGWFEVRIVPKDQKGLTVNYSTTMVLPKGLDNIRKLLNRKAV